MNSTERERKKWSGERRACLMRMKVMKKEMWEIPLEEWIKIRWERYV